GLHYGGVVRRMEATGRLLHPHRRHPLPEAIRGQGRHGVHDVAHRERRGGDRARLVVLRPPRARPHQDPVLLPEDRRRASGRGRAPPQTAVVAALAPRVVLRIPLAPHGRSPPTRPVNPPATVKTPLTILMGSMGRRRGAGPSTTRA